MKKLFLSFVVVVLLLQAVPAANYYVSKSGSDSNAGTSTNVAFLTIQKAASVMNAGDTCFILSGIYRETVTPVHSGTSSSPITFTAYPGAIPIVSGADILNLSWSVYSNSIYQASTASSFRQLFVDGVMMNEARWPNAAVNNLLYAPRSTPGFCTNTYLSDPSLPNVNLLGATLHIYPDEYNNPGYAANTRQITAWDPSTKTISWSGNIFNSGAQSTFYYVYGALSLLDIPTEWYLNTASGTLYLWTPNGSSPATHVVEVKDRTSAFTLDNLSYIEVSGIYVFGAGISMASTTNCIVNNCNLIYVQHNTTADWTTSVPIANQVSGSGSIWENSVITFSSQDGIRCTGQNEVVSNCVIEQVDYYPGTYYAGVTAFSGGAGTKIVNNTLWFSGRYCVGSSSVSNEIAYNDLGYGTLLTSDGGATYEYASGTGGGTKIHHNWAHNCWAGIYVDQNQNDYLIYRNVCWSNYYGLCFNSFTNNLIINNTAASNTIDILFNGSADVDVTNINNIWYSFSGSYGNNNDVAENNGWYPPLGPNYVPQAGSGAIDNGVIYPPYTDGYVGSGPDIGAYEAGGTYWSPGANFTPQPFPNIYALPYILKQPASQTSIVGQTATLSVTATSVSPISYQWQAGATGSGVYTNLIAGGQLSAVTNATLIISNLVLGNTADYVVVMTNSNGSVASAVATLTVINPQPSIVTQPASLSRIVNQTAAFSVTAAGLPPFYYQWRAGTTGGGVFTNLIAGGQFPAVTNATLTISNVALGNAADYVVVVTNSSGSITSSVATLTVLTNPTPYEATVLADHPYAYWPLQETNGPIIYDLAGSNNGTMFEATDAVGSNNSHTSFATNNGAAFGMRGPGVLFGDPNDAAIYFTNANGADIVIPYMPALDVQSNWTAECWLNIPATYGFNNSGTEPVAMCPVGFEANTGQQYGWFLQVQSDLNGNPANGRVDALIAKAGGNMNGWTTLNGDQRGGQWVQVVMTYDGTTLALYENATLINSTRCTYRIMGDGTGHTLPLVMGSYCLNYFNGSPSTGFERQNFYQGGMSHVAVYTNILSANQILNHYQVATTGIPIAPPKMSIQLSASNVIVSWTSGSLQEAAAVAGPWTDVANAVSPYSVGATNTALFFRAKF